MEDTFPWRPSLLGFVIRELSCRTGFKARLAKSIYLHSIFRSQDSVAIAVRESQIEQECSSLNVVNA